MSIRSSVVYSVLAAYFALAGAFTLLNVAAVWNFPHMVLWAGLLYVLLDFILAWGLWHREKWVWAALILNAAGMVVLLCARALAGMPVALGWSVAGLALSVVLAWYAYATRRSLAHSGTAAAVLFYAVWIIMFGYTVYTSFV